MSDFASGIMYVGDDPNGAAITVPAGQGVTVTHNAGKRAVAIFPIEDGGGVIATTDFSDGITISSNGPDNFLAFNNTAGSLDLRFMVVFEIPTPLFSGRIPTGDARIVVA